MVRKIVAFWKKITLEITVEFSVWGMQTLAKIPNYSPKYPKTSMKYVQFVPTPKKNPQKIDPKNFGFGLRPTCLKVPSGTYLDLN